MSAPTDSASAAIAIEGQQGLGEAIALHRLVDQHLRAGRDVVLDFSTAEFVGSAAMQTFVACARDAGDQGRKLRFVSVPPRIVDDFTLMGLGAWFEPFLRERD